MASFLRKRTDEGARNRFRPYDEKSRKQIERELALIEKLELEGYFLIVWDIVQFCLQEQNSRAGPRLGRKQRRLLCAGNHRSRSGGMDCSSNDFFQKSAASGRTSISTCRAAISANAPSNTSISATAQLGAAMTANVITYRGRSAAREVGKALGFDTKTLDRVSSLVGHLEWKDPNPTRSKRSSMTAGFDLRQPRIRKFLDCTMRLQDLPRHLGQHSGGMVVCQGQLDSRRSAGAGNHAGTHRRAVG